MIGLLRVRGVAAGGTDQHLVFANLGEVHELLAVLAADRPGVSLDRDGGDADALEQLGVGREYRGIGLVERLPVGVERVHVLHRKLAQADQPAARPDFVPELGLDLIDERGQFSIALHLALEQLDDDLLVRRAQRQLPLAPVLDDQQRRHVRIAPAGCLPQLDRLQHRHVHLLAAGGVHLFPDHLLDLAQRPPAQRQKAVDAGGELLHQPGPQQKLVTGRLRLGGRVAQRAGEEMREAHVV